MLVESKWIDVATAAAHMNLSKGSVYTLIRTATTCVWCGCSLT